MVHFVRQRDSPSIHAVMAERINAELHRSDPAPRTVVAALRGAATLSAGLPHMRWASALAHQDAAARRCTYGQWQACSSRMLSAIR